MILSQKMRDKRNGEPAWPEKKKSSPKKYLFMTTPKSLPVAGEIGPMCVSETKTALQKKKSAKLDNVKGMKFGCKIRRNKLNAINKNVPYTKSPSTSMVGVFERMISVTELLARAVA